MNRKETEQILEHYQYQDTNWKRNKRYSDEVTQVFTRAGDKEHWLSIKKKSANYVVVTQTDYSGKIVLWDDYQYVYYQYEAGKWKEGQWKLIRRELRMKIKIVQIELRVNGKCITSKETEFIRATQLCISDNKVLREKFLKLLENHCILDEGERKQEILEFLSQKDFDMFMEECRELIEKS
ncbi:MAG: hypothetical protein HFJ09_09440 [Lachnospiraceae bacterium]|nr:hypothetical protein [Lachnospiraceae bacterium]